MIHVALSTDLRGFSYCATLIASIARRASKPIHIKCWCRKFLPESFKVGSLRVDFIQQDEEIGGSYPGHVPGAVFDRLRVIPEALEWERCLIMDHDMVVLCDLAPYFEEDFEGNLLMGRLFGPGNTLGFQVAQRGGLPPEWQHTLNHPYFYMGPMMNLTAMRQRRTWEKLIAAHAAIGYDEQISLTAACDGLVKGVSPRWNVVPQWDKLSEIESHFGGVPKGDSTYKNIPLVNGIPSGIIHWTGGYKPWSHGTKVWRHDIWEAERCSWEQLREGDWLKPIVCEVEPENGLITRAMARRGCAVKVVTSLHKIDADWVTSLDDKDVPFPDVHCCAHSELETQYQQQVRFGSQADVLSYLKCHHPSHIILCGPRTAQSIAAIKALGFTRQHKILTKMWPTGGPLAKIMNFEQNLVAEDLLQGEELYLQWHSVPTESILISDDIWDNYQYKREDFTWQVSDELELFIRHELKELLTQKPTILELGPGFSTFVIKECLPDSEMISFEHDQGFYQRYRRMMSHLTGHHLIHAPLDPTLPWYSCDGLPEKEIDLLLIDGPSRYISTDIRHGSLCLISRLSQNAIVILDDAEKDITLVSKFLETGMEIVTERDRFVVFRNHRKSVRLRNSFNEIKDIAQKIYVISLPEREDRRKLLEDNWRSISLDYEIIDGVTPEVNSIAWAEMKGMEAYGQAENLRTPYIVGAVGCKRAGIKALRAFIDSGADTALICQDDCHWKNGATTMITHALQELPQDWDLLYFSASARKPHLPYSPHLARLQGARLCTAVLWNRRMAMLTIEDLETCDCEWDLFMQRLHAKHQCFVCVPMPAYQAKSFSNIVRAITKVSNK